MTKKFTCLAAAVALACMAVGCNQNQPGSSAAPGLVAPAPATPDGAITAAIAALRANNVAAFLDNALPAAHVAKIKADWTKEINKEPVTDDDRKKFAENMTKLTAPDAEAKLYAELEPQLKQFDAQMQQQMPMMIAMGQGLAQSAISQSKEMNDQQKKQAEATLDAMAKWAQTAKFTDPTLVKQALAAVCKAARDLNIKSLDEVRALNFDQAIQKAGIILGGTKRVFDVYGLSMDKALDSVKVETVSAQGDNAKVKVTYTAFDQPFTTESDLVKVDGRWYGKQAIDQWNKMQQEAANPSATATPAATGKPGGN